MDEIYSILTGCPLFRGLAPERIAELVPQDTYTFTKFEKGDLVARQDTAYSGLMIIVRGRASGTFTYPSGKTADIETIEAPELIMPAYLFGGYNRMPVDVRAEMELEILTIHRGYLFELMQEDTIVLSNFIDIISNRAGVWSKKIYALSVMSLKEKLAAYLLDHSGKDGEVAVRDMNEMAAYFGATRSAVLAVIEQLEKKHVVALRDDSISILNRSALQDLLD